MPIFSFFSSRNASSRHHDRNYALEATMKTVCDKRHLFVVGSQMARSCFPPGPQMDKCAAQLRTSGAWPSNSKWSQTIARYSSHAVLFVGDSTIRSKWATLRAMGVPDGCAAGSSGSCFVYSEANCTTFSNAALRRDFSAVVFNVGMHYLRNVEGRATSWNDYTALLTQCAQRVASAYPQARLVYMLTNSICEDKWDGPFNAQRKRMRSIEASEATPSDKYLMQWGRIGTDTINMAERVVVPSLSNGPGGAKWELIATRTREHCDCTAMHDGRHFLPLAPDLLVRLSKKLWGRAESAVGHTRRDRAAAVARTSRR